jgi:hypothetical protein
VPKVLLHVPGFVVEYRNVAVVALEFGMPEPFSVADVDATLVAAAVVMLGGAAVVNERTTPKPRPSTFEPIAQ